jgi:hypothetical protein
MSHFSQQCDIRELKKIAFEEETKIFDVSINCCSLVIMIHDNNGENMAIVMHRYSLISILLFVILFLFKKKALFLKRPNTMGMV